MLPASGAGSDSEESGKPMHVLVLACGNPLRGDDGVGPRIGHAMGNDPSFAGFEVVVTRQLLPEHAESISLAEIVLFVDCSAVTAPGTVSCIPIQPADSLPRIFTHHLDPASLLKLSLDLYGRAPSRAAGITVGGESYEQVDALSQAVEAAVPAAIHTAIEEIRAQLRSKTNNSRSE